MRRRVGEWAEDAKKFHLAHVQQSGSGKYLGETVREGVKEISVLLHEAVKFATTFSRGFSTEMEKVFIWRTGDSRLICLSESGAVAVNETV